MGELILCGQQMAALPYYIDTISLNVYSLEELSYYVEQNLYLIEQEFMDEELCAWVEQELKMNDLATQLREIRQTKGTLSEFVICLLSASSYSDKESLKKIRQVLLEMENKTDFECGKIRADRYMENQKYVCAMNEYRKLLMQPEENEVLVGDVWHNLGTAYARQFFFEKAASCYSHAYELNQNKKSLSACLMAYRCLKDERGFKRKAAAGFLSEDEAAEIAGHLSKISRMEEICEFEQKMDEVFETEERQERVASQIEMWKEEYRKNCKV